MLILGNKYQCYHIISLSDYQRVQTHLIHSRIIHNVLNIAIMSCIFIQQQPAFGFRGLKREFCYDLRAFNLLVKNLFLNPSLPKLNRFVLVYFNDAF